MTYEQACDHLKDIISQEDGGLRSLGWYLDYEPGENKACLDGDFEIEDLEAIAVYMRHSQAKG